MFFPRISCNYVSHTDKTRSQRSNVSSRSNAFPLFPIPLPPFPGMGGIGPLAFGLGAFVPIFGIPGDVRKSRSESWRGRANDFADCPRSGGNVPSFACANVFPAANAGGGHSVCPSSGGGGRLDFDWTSGLAAPIKQSVISCPCGVVTPIPTCLFYHPKNLLMSKTTSTSVSNVPPPPQRSLTRPQIIFPPCFHPSWLSKQPRYIFMFSKF